MFYVYRFIDKDDHVLYVGKSSDLIGRLKTHISNGHLSPTCYKQVYDVEYLEFNLKVEMDIAELYYINLYKPPYNQLDKEKDNLSLTLETAAKWKRLTSFDFKFVYGIKYKQMKSDIACKEAKKKYYEAAHMSAPYITKDSNWVKSSNARIAYVNTLTRCSIGLNESTIGCYSMKEVILMLAENPNLSFISVNQSTCVQLSLYSKYILKAQDLNHSIASSKQDFCLVEINRNIRKSSKSEESCLVGIDDGDYVLRGVIPFLLYRLQNEEFYIKEK